MMYQNSNNIFINSKTSSSLFSRQVIINHFEGDQTSPTLRKLSKGLLDLADKMRRKDQPVLIFSDINNLSSVNLSARKAILKLLQELDYDRWAMVGINLKAINLVKLMIATSGRSFKIRVFENKAEAASWLLS